MGRHERAARAHCGVLVADDDLDLARLLRRMLAVPRIAPRDCLEAHTGAEALRLLRARSAPTACCST